MSPPRDLSFVSQSRQPEVLRCGRLAPSLKANTNLDRIESQPVSTASRANSSRINSSRAVLENARTVRVYDALFHKRGPTMRDFLLRLTMTIASCLCVAVTRADELGLKQVTIDGQVTIYAPGSEIGHTMPQVRRHPDGAIYVNGCRSGLFKSTDNGKSWTRITWAFDPNGFGISRDGRLWLVDRRDKTESSVILIIQSADGGRTWQRQELDCGPLAAGGADDPYTAVTPHGAYTNFIERPDGTLMFSVSMRYKDWGDFNNRDQSRPGMRDVMVRTADGGKTWGDPTIVHQHATETDFAIDPSNADHLLAFTRIQRRMLPGEDRSETGCSFGWPYKNGLLLDSTDGGRTFRALPGGMTECYGHRGSILWTDNNVIVVTRNHGCKTIEERRARGHSGAAVEAQISLNGGRTWVDDGPGGTPHLNRAKPFTLIPFRKAHSFTCPTVELSKNRFLTVFVTGETTEKTTSIQSVVWHIETTPPPTKK